MATGTIKTWINFLCMFPKLFFITIQNWLSDFMVWQYGPWSTAFWLGDLYSCQQRDGSRLLTLNSRMVEKPIIVAFDKTCHVVPELFWLLFHTLRYVWFMPRPSTSPGYHPAWGCLGPRLSQDCQGKSQHEMSLMPQARDELLLVTVHESFIKMLDFRNYPR